MVNENNNFKKKKALILIIMLVLFLPLFQQIFTIPKIKELKGYINIEKKADFSFEKWFSEEYQEQFNKYLNQNFGFRPYFVRIYNQIQYSFFDKINANGVIIGKDGYLYEENYIKSYIGSDFIGKSKIIEKTNKLKFIQDSLEKLGKNIIVVFAPGKGSFYPEYIPDEYIFQKKDSTNYKAYIEEFKLKKINYLDLNKWFIEQKSKSEYPLVPKNGIHWSKYGEVISADTILKFIEKISGFKMSKIVIDTIEESYIMRDTDDDVEKGLNLLFNIDDIKMAYPKFHFKKESEISPKVITIADSYYWGMFNFGLSKEAFNNGDFWYYNKQVYPITFNKETLVDSLDLTKQINDTDIFLLICTDANLFKFAFNFIDMIYDKFYHNSKISLKEQRILHYINAIKETPEWYESIIKSAQKSNLPLEEVLRSNAEYMVWQENQ